MTSYILLPLESPFFVNEMIDLKTCDLMVSFFISNKSDLN